MKVPYDDLKKLIEASSYGLSGDASERQHGYILADCFPNSEKFWKHFIVPFTNRINLGNIDPSQIIHVREGTSKDLHDIGSFHYSIFYNLLLAHLALTTKHSSYFESFYTHLGSICDSVEEFLIKVYFIIQECEKTKSEVLEKLSKESFLQLAGEWYDENYNKVYEYYLSVGKPPPIRLPMRSSVLEEYFKKSIDWKNYKRFSQKIREYRNVIVHNFQIAFILFPNGVSYVPKKECIGKYKKWDDVFTGAKDPNKFKQDFIQRELQMTHDLKDMMIILNNLWEKPITDMSKLFFIDKNQILLAKYNLSFS